MKSKLILTLVMAAIFCLGTSAQSSMPAPGTSMGGGKWGGGNSFQAPGQQIPGAGGGYWGPGMGNFPTPPAPIGYPNWQSSGSMSVIAAGYDVYGDLYQIPMNVYYWYNGVTYNVTVRSAYNPDTDMWEYGLNMPAYSTSYNLRGTWFNYYVPLSFGTFYFNL